MKKTISITLLLMFLILPVLTVAAEDAGSNMDVKPFGLDAGIVLSTGYLQSDDPLLNGLSLLFLLRGGVTVTGRYRINDKMSTGGEIGLTFMSMSTSEGGEATTFFDMPINAVFRYGGGKTFIEPHIGYYLSASLMDFSGFSVGAKGSLNNFYVDFTFIIGSEYQYPRFGFGWQWNNIF